GSVRINGSVAGDVVASSGKLELGPNARIGGKVQYAGRGEIQRDPAAQVAGGVERMPFKERAAHSERRMGGVVSYIWTAGLMLVAILLVAVLPVATARITTTLSTRIGASLLAGFIALIGVPIAVVILLITVIGIPLALAALTLYFALLIVAYAMTGVG